MKAARELFRNRKSPLYMALVTAITLIAVVGYPNDAKALEPAQKAAICQQIEKRIRAFADLKQKLIFDLENPVWAPPPNDTFKSGFAPEVHRAERDFVSHMGDLGILLNKLPSEGREGRLKGLGELFSFAYYRNIGRASECKDAALDPAKKDYYMLLKKDVKKDLIYLEGLLQGLKKVAAKL